ncbi:MAG: serpin family protein, partial [Deltaproteobacteria bacterium]|nr:serpin family protein [Deltaproteobacteria bacterium]
SGTMPVARHDGATIVELDYGIGDYAMTFVVPDRADALAALERRFDRAWLAEGLAAMSDTQVTLGVPKFRIEADRPLALRSVLGAMGVSQVFTSEADLTGIAPRSEQLMVSEAFHKAFLELDEAGTEAAAATAIATRTGAAAPPEGGTRVVLDRPFLFALRDRDSGAMLFLGHVVDPTR